MGDSLDGAPGSRTVKAAAAEAIERSRDRLVAISHDLAADPEVAWMEHQAAARLCSELTRAGFDVQTGVGGLDTAFHAVAGSGARHVAVIAEYDALPGLGHACGHNIIAASTVGTALGLVDHVEDLNVTLHVIGAPAEEGGGGKILLLEAGEFAGIDAAMMVHPGPSNALYARPYAVAHWRVRYEGFGAHAAAYPELGRNAADAFTVAQVAIGLLRQQLPGDVRVHGIVSVAGTAANAIPACSEGSWYVRAPDLAQLDALCERVQRCFEAGATATGCTLRIDETSPRYADFRNDDELAALFSANAKERGLDMEGGGGMSTASTDMGNVSQQVRAIHPYIGIDSLPAVNHQPEFAEAAVAGPADGALIDAAVIMAWTLIDFAGVEEDPTVIPRE